MRREVSSPHLTQSTPLFFTHRRDHHQGFQSPFSYAYYLLFVVSLSWLSLLRASGGCRYTCEGNLSSLHEYHVYVGTYGAHGLSRQVPSMNVYSAAY